MKRTVLAVSLAVLSVPFAARAQSSVTLFGVLDEGLNVTSNAGGHTAWQTSSVDVATSRWGIKGVEDLGGGVQAIFDLESGVTLDDGRAYYAGRLFGYQAYVGLQSSGLGTLTAGRQFDTVTDTIGLMTANGNWGGYLFSHPLDNDNTDGSFHANNALKYTTPEYGGLSATSMYGFSNQPSFANNRILGVGLKYHFGPLALGAVFQNLSAPGRDNIGSVAADDYGFIAENQKIYGLAGSYSVGPATVSATYTHVVVRDPESSIYIGQFEGLNVLRFDNMEVNVKYNVSAALFVAGMYTYSLGHVNQGGQTTSLHWNQIGAMAQYSLSARTALYAQAVYQKVSGNSGVSGLDTAFIPGSAGSSSNSHQIVGRLGITHTF
jgi:predicted porin